MQVKIFGMSCRVEIIVISIIVGMILGAHVLCSCVTPQAKQKAKEEAVVAAKKAEEEKRVASRQAYMFFNNKASSIVAYSKAKEYKFDRDEKDKISVNDCISQLEKWAEKQAEQFAETTPQGQRLSYLKALQTKAKDLVAEASVSDDLKSSLAPFITALKGLEIELK